MRIAAIAVVSLLTCLPFALAQTNEQPTATFHSGVDLVLVPTIVRDNGGNHVPGLTKDDFSIMENGKPQPITVFEEVSAGDKVTLPRVRKGEVTNVVSAGAAPTRVTILLLDMLNTPFADQAYARDQLLKYLVKNLDAREPTTLLGLKRNGLIVLHDFTTDSRALIAAVNAATGSHPLDANPQSSYAADVLPQLIMQGNNDPNLSANDPLVRQAADELERIQQFRTGPDAQFANYQREGLVSATLTAFQQIAQAFAGIPGRKSLIWSTGGIPFNVTSSGTFTPFQIFSEGVMLRRMDSKGNLGTMADNDSTLADREVSLFAPYWERTMQMLNDANVSVYPVDARGLEVLFTGADRSTFNAAVNRDTRLEKAESRAALDSFATMTGGKAFLNRNDLATGFKAAAEDNTSYYMLGFTRKESKGGWKKIDVKVSRPGLQVRARHGYMGISAKTDPKTIQQIDLAVATKSPLNFTAIPLYVAFKPPSGERSGTKRKVGYSLWMPGSALPNDGKLQFVIMAIATKKNGDKVDQRGENLSSTISPDVMARIRKEGMSYEGSLELPPGDYDVRVIVRDNRTSDVGSVHTNVSVPAS
jgi:VWFA-related protein